MANVKILVLSDGETWERFYHDTEATVMEIAQGDYQRLCDGEVAIYDLGKEGKIISEKNIKEAD